MADFNYFQMPTDEQMNNLLGRDNTRVVINKPFELPNKKKNVKSKLNPAMEGYEPRDLDEAWNDIETAELAEDVPQVSNAAQPQASNVVQLPTEPRKTYTPQVRRESFLSKLIRPYEDELEAARNGMRWHWALQNRWMLPGSKWNETVWNGVDRENQYLSRLIKQQNGMAGAREHQIAKSSWDKFVSDMYNGNWDNYGRTYEEAMDWADKYKQWYASQGWDPTDLRPIGTSMGKLNNSTRKALTDMATDLSDTEQYMTDIAGWVADDSWNDPIKSAMIKDYLDKVSQKLSAALGGDSKSMADAEKVRIQILYLPAESMKLVQEEIKNYRDWLSAVQAYASQKGWSQDIQGRINRAKDSLDMASKTGDQSNISTLAGQAMSYLTSALGSTEKNSEHALDIQTVLGSGVQQHKDYMSDMVLAADVDPARVFMMAKQLHDLTMNRYNNEVKRSNREADTWRGKPTPEVDIQKLHDVVRPSPFLTPNVYHAPVIERPKGERVSPNQQSVGELKSKTQLPADATFVTTGVKL